MSTSTYPCGCLPIQTALYPTITALLTRIGLSEVATWEVQMALASFREQCSPEVSLYLI